MGRELYGKVGDWYHQHATDANVVLMDKNCYSEFANTNLDNYLRSRRVTDITLAGVCTDIYILHTAVSAYNLAYELTIPENAAASFNSTGHEWTIPRFQSILGAKTAPILIQ